MIVIMQIENWVHDGIEIISVPDTVEAAAAEVEDEASEDSVSAGVIGAYYW